MARMNQHIVELRQEIAKLATKLHVLAQEKETIERKYNQPSIFDVLEPRVPQWGEVSKAVFNTTVRKIVPAVTEISETARLYRERVASTSKFLALLTSLVIYGFVLGSVYLSMTLYRKLRGKLTISRLIFACDTFCACFWVLTLICYAVLWADPLHVLQHRTPVLFFVLQLLAIVAYAFYVFLRVVVVAVKMTPGPLGELLSVIVAGQHYYVRVWQPAITDLYFHGTAFYYFCYAWLFSAFAYNRAQEFIPLQQLRGPSLGFWTWVQVAYARFASKDHRLDPEEASMYSDTDSDYSHDD
eukprot:Plantae.Rhodophyta-Rhodochaete_pulchella.ctg6167.p1 GENE.Plantae.Rhodophyta-Rhodochaete_pulchella.ctg6167~~Plantae.Rhodophyta-Rhodochaete_pulchella.ctg6167.p1  ORF type:complete len:322 (+),score=53.53 Plantae.Rhodophyta-Rhodochaete_pulchella.ctg6167:71-967(+)